MIIAIQLRYKEDSVSAFMLKGVCFPAWPCYTVAGNFRWCKFSYERTAQLNVTTPQENVLR